MVTRTHLVSRRVEDPVEKYLAEPALFLKIQFIWTRDVVAELSPICLDCWATPSQVSGGCPVHVFTHLSSTFCVQALSWVLGAEQ